MPSIQALRLGLALTALVLFGFGIQSDANYLRLGGIVCLSAALILRFAGRGTPKG